MLICNSKGLLVMSLTDHLYAPKQVQPARLVLQYHFVPKEAIVSAAQRSHGCTRRLHQSHSFSHYPKLVTHGEC